MRGGNSREGGMQRANLPHQETAYNIPYKQLARLGNQHTEGLPQGGSVPTNITNLQAVLSPELGNIEFDIIPR